ncbi:MAG: PilN domain-containing protein [Deltaproteobacteria bacterium]|jgi:type IV pilus assembly protein PilN|nr:PilN domain-containing protein [Deltaproteobacteria bacterium]
MIRINLLPVKAAQKKEMLKSQIFIAFLALIITCGICGTAYMHILGKVQDKQSEIDQKRFEISKLMKTIGEVNQFKKRQKELRAKLDILEQLKSARSGPVILLDELYKAIPDKVWLTSFSEGGGTINVSGIGVSEETVAMFMRNLERSNFFKSVELKITQQNLQSGVKFQKFDLYARTVSTDRNITTTQPQKAKKPPRGGT